MTEETNVIKALRWWLRRLAVVTERREGSDEQPAGNACRGGRSRERDKRCGGGGLDR
jgi:hypothetical protein